MENKQQRQGVLVWLTRYWFWFPIVGCLLFMACVFFGYGEHSYIAVHDNMDLFLAQYQMLKNTGLFWKSGQVPFLGGISRDNLPAAFSLYSLLYWIFPTYIAYVLGLLCKVLLGMCSFRLLAKELYPEKYKCCRPAVYMVGFTYGMIWFFPAFGFAFASIPLCVYLLIRIYRKPTVLLYVGLFCYPLISYFSYHGIFILGYLVLAIIWLWIRDRKFPVPLAGALLVLSGGYVLCEYRLFMQMLLNDEVTIRSSIVNASLTLPEVGAEIADIWKNGMFHADGVQKKFVLPICVAYFVGNNIYYIVKKRAAEIVRDPFNFVMLFLVFNSLIYGLYDFEPVRGLVETLLPPLEGWQFNRTVFFNPFLWYAAFLLIILRFYDKNMIIMWISNILLCVAALIVIVTPTRYNDLFTTCYNRFYEYNHGEETDAYDYEQFYAVELFDRIKEDIGYDGEWSVAYGLHPAVLEYNGIATLDGYLGFYSQEYKERFRKVIAPALERVEASRIYYDEWGARVYLYSGENDSIVTSGKYINTADDVLYIDPEAFKELGGTYIFSRIQFSNAEELGLELRGTYTAQDGSSTVYVYR